MRPIETTLAARGPYDLRHVAAGSGDATRRFRDGTLTMAFETPGGSATASVAQRRDGRLRLRLEGPHPDAAVDHLRFVLAVDDDHTEFLRRFAKDPLIGHVTRLRQGMRPLRTGTVSHALLRAVCGQLIAAREARQVESRVIRALCPRHGDLRLPPTSGDLAATSPARLAQLGLASRKGAAVVRLSRALDLERLRGMPTSAVVRRLCAEPTLGPWSAGVVCLQGLGRREHGLVGDLALIKLCSSLLGREATADDTAELLSGYGEWAGYASLYLKASGKIPSMPRSAFRSSRASPPGMRVG
ncbi:MAG: DNA-3-methyladenine glycosylase family protein [Gaiellales bacterium]